jgi:sporulation protein YunB
MLGKRWRRRKRKKSVRVKDIAFMLLAAGFSIYVICLAYYAIDRHLKTTVADIAVARAHQLATEAVNRAIYEQVLANVNYEDLIMIHKDKDARVTMMQADTIRISRIVTEAGIKIRAALKEIEEEDFTIPMGQILGLDLLASKGPRLPVQIIPMGMVSVSTSEVFEQAGINQVKHILYLNIETDMKIVIPVVQESVHLVSKIPIVENVIIGQVPEAYFSGLLDKQ